MGLHSSVLRVLRVQYPLRHHQRRRQDFCVHGDLNRQPVHHENYHTLYRKSEQCCLPAFHVLGIPAYMDYSYGISDDLHVESRLDEAERTKNRIIQLRQLFGCLFLC